MRAEASRLRATPAPRDKLVVPGSDADAMAARMPGESCPRAKADNLTR